jgi:hypothetical protein
MEVEDEGVLLCKMESKMLSKMPNLKKNSLDLDEDQLETKIRDEC